MNIRSATLEDAAAVAAIYGPIVQETAISFEWESPTVEEMRARIARTIAIYPWLVAIDQADNVAGYVYAGRHRDPASYQWSVNTSAYVREDVRGRGIGRMLYGALFEELVRLGYFRAFAGIALPNVASVALHERVGFRPLGVYERVGFKHGAWHDVGWWQHTLQEGEPINPPRLFGSEARPQEPRSAGPVG
jgi:phosphinothricin acetyltransferase